MSVHCVEPSSKNNLSTAFTLTHADWIIRLKLNLSVSGICRDEVPSVTLLVPIAVELSVFMGKSHSS